MNILSKEFTRLSSIKFVLQIYKADQINQYIINLRKRFLREFYYVSVTFGASIINKRTLQLDSHLVTTNVLLRIVFSIDT